MLKRTTPGWLISPGTLLIIPVADLAQHLLLGLCYFLQNDAVIRDDVHGCPIPGIESSKTSSTSKTPLTFVEQWSLIEVTAELSTSCYAGVLMLQAMGGPFHPDTPGPWKDSGKI
jgi:hypothetical protein